jgi:serine/threonine protein kinase
MSLGLEYLHTRKICHGDLKAVCRLGARGSSLSQVRPQINVLVEEYGRALLCDFGLTRIKADITSRTRTMGDTVVSGSRNWMAPELLLGSLPRTPSDVYSFGMTLYEVCVCARCIHLRCRLIVLSHRFTRAKSQCPLFLTTTSLSSY